VEKGFVSLVKPLKGEVVKPKKVEMREECLYRPYKPKDTVVHGSMLYQTRPILNDYINKIFDFSLLRGEPEVDKWYMMTVWVRKTEKGYIEMGV
jgi:hypothetical protein